MLPPLVQFYLEEHQYGHVTGSQPVAGGCISSGKILTTQSGATFFLKINPNTPTDMFAREAEGLLALQVNDGPKVPDVFLHGPDFILLEDLAPAPHHSEYWPTFGRELAAMHNHTDTQFGFDHDNYIGSTRQPNPHSVDGHSFFIKNRLLFQAQMAQKHGLLGDRDMREMDSIINRLATLVPHQPASLLHGDLWSGNAITDSSRTCHDRAFWCFPYNVL
jgi:fructosamine-3-kinase